MHRYIHIYIYIYALGASAWGPLLFFSVRFCLPLLSIAIGNAFAMPTAMGGNGWQCRGNADGNGMPWHGQQWTASDSNADLQKTKNVSMKTHTHSNDIYLSRDSMVGNKQYKHVSLYIYMYVYIHYREIHTYIYIYIYKYIYIHIMCYSCIQCVNIYIYIHLYIYFMYIYDIIYIYIYGWVSLALQ